ncbi:MAG: phosphate/phosphite/phosphonate ABC transporter substrate-binding protein [Candidatus Sericytochromatia bacterium]|nr:phosphate/phosphite/phosphonate ABC transporter substrate-binding protein [Candidatus Sericytochromatia bacterium]
MARRVPGVLLVAALLALPSGGAAATPTGLKVGFAPFENQKEVLRKATPIVRYLSKRLGRPITPFVAGDYPGVVEAMKGGKLDVAFLSPAALVLAEKVAGVRVVLKSAYRGRTHYYSAIITHADSGLTSLKDLKGRSFAFVDPGSTTGGVYPKLMLLNAGLNPATDFSAVINAGGHDASILAVANRKVDAAATFANDDRGDDVPWKHILADRASQIRVLGYSKPIPNGAVAVGKHLPEATTVALRQAFLDLSATDEGRSILKQMYLIERFVPASSADYDPVREAFARVGLSLK